MGEDLFEKKAGLLDTPKRGVIKITEQGLAALAQSPARIDRQFLLRFPEFRAFVTQRNEPAEEPVPSIGSQNASGPEGTPEEILERAYQTLRAQLAHELVERIKKAPARFFESLVIDLLVAMGYGGSRQDALATSEPSIDHLEVVPERFPRCLTHRGMRCRVGSVALRASVVSEGNVHAARKERHERHRATSKGRRG